MAKLEQEDAAVNTRVLKVVAPGFSSQSRQGASQISSQLAPLAQAHLLFRLPKSHRSPISRRPASHGAPKRLFQGLTAIPLHHDYRGRRCGL